MQVQRLVEKKESDNSIDTLPFVGAVLQSFIAGWDEGECFKVQVYMCVCYKEWFYFLISFFGTGFYIPERSSVPVSFGWYKTFLFTRFKYLCTSND